MSIRQEWSCPECRWGLSQARAYGDPPRPPCGVCGRPMARAHWTDDDCQLVLDEDWDAIQADHARAQAEKDRQAVPCRN
jgi:hypothetical protein